VCVIFAVAHCDVDFTLILHNDFTISTLGTNSPITAILAETNGVGDVYVDVDAYVVL
jgi:hypothetical protein